MKFLGQGFQKLEHKQDRWTRTDRDRKRHYQSYLQVVTKQDKGKDTEIGSTPTVRFTEQ